MNLTDIIYNDVMLFPDYELMSVDDDLQSCYMEEFGQVVPDPFIANLSEHELWQYLQLIVMGEPMETESFIDNNEVDSSDMEIDDVSIDTSDWGDEDSDFESYGVFPLGPLVLDPLDYTDDEAIAG